MFSATYKGFKEDFEKKKQRGQTSKFHRNIILAANDLAEAYIALGGPDYEAPALEY